MEKLESVSSFPFIMNVFTHLKLAETGTRHVDFPTRTCWASEEGAERSGSHAWRRSGETGGDTPLPWVGRVKRLSWETGRLPLR